MKSYLYKVLLLSGAFATVGSSFSLYDAAPMVGLPESYDIKYSSELRLGYDSNVNWSSRHEDASPYVSASVGARYADMESVNKLSYNVRLGFTHYTGLEERSSFAETRADCMLSASMVYAFDSVNTLSSSLNATYSPQPDYADGYSPAYCYGDMLALSYVNVYSHAIDSRWSLNGTLAFRLITYSESEEQDDNRYYLEGGVGAQYRESSIMTYKTNLSYTRELRDKGLNSDRYVASVGFQRALDPFSSCGADVGIAARVYSVKTIWSPCGKISYRRKLTEGLNVQAYASYADENAGSYMGYGSGSQTYLENRTVRFGTIVQYVLSPDVTYSFGVSYFITERSSSTSVASAGVTSDQYEISAGMSYAFTNNLRGSLRAAYSSISREYEGRSDNSADRWNFSAGVTYTF